MRTKALLAAALLAAGVATSMAQSSNVYSLNIVGYVNVSAPAGNTILANPLDKDGTNSANKIFTYGANVLPDGTIISTWTGYSYDSTTYDASLGIDPGNWYDSNLNAKAPPLLPPGKGFFINLPTAYTNTFTGNTIPGPASTNTVSVPAGNQLVGSR